MGALLSRSVDVGPDGPSDARRASVERARRGRILLGLLGGLAALLIVGRGTLAPLAVASALLVAGACYWLGAGLVRVAQTTFVGDEGLARFSHRPGQAIETLRFADVTALRVARVAAAASRSFRYSFERAGGPPFFIRGNHALLKSGEPDAHGDHPLWFASAAEQAYIAYRMPRVLATISEGGEVRFEVSKREALTFSTKGLKLEPAKGGVHQCQWRELGEVRVNGEMLELVVPEGAPTVRTLDDGNPFSAPLTDRSMTTVIFRLSELPDIEILLALISKLKVQKVG
jgi:hypothetical protein